MEVQSYTNILKYCVSSFDPVYTHRVFKSPTAIDFSGRPKRELTVIPESPEKVVKPVTKKETVKPKKDDSEAAPVPTEKKNAFDAMYQARFNLTKKAEELKEKIDAQEKARAKKAAEKKKLREEKKAAKKAAKKDAEESGSDDSDDSESDDSVGDEDEVNKLHEPKFVSTHTSVKGDVVSMQEEIDDEMMKLEEAANPNKIADELMSGPAAIVYDTPETNATEKEKDRLLKKLAKKRKVVQVAERIDMQERVNELEARFDKGSGEGSDNYEDEDAPIEKSADKLAAAKVVATDPSAEGTSKAAKSMFGSMLKKKKTVAEAPPPVESLTTEMLMPELLYRRMLTPSGVKGIEKMIDIGIATVKNLTEAEKKNFVQFIKVRLSEGLVLIEATHNNAKDMALISAAAQDLYDMCNGDYSEAKMRSVYKQSKQRCWLSEAEKGVRKMNSTGEKGEDDPPGIRGVDWAYTKWCIKNSEKLLPASYQEKMASFLFERMLKTFVKIAYAEFVVTDSQYAQIIEALPPGSQWKCAMTDFPIEVGDSVICIGGAQSALNAHSTDIPEELKKSLKHGAFKGFGISTERQFFASDLASPELANAPYYAFVLRKKSTAPPAAKPEPPKPSAEVAPAPVVVTKMEVDEASPKKELPPAAVSASGKIPSNNLPPVIAKEEPVVEKRVEKRKADEVGTDEEGGGGGDSGTEEEGDGATGKDASKNGKVRRVTNKTPRWLKIKAEFETKTIDPIEGYDITKASLFDLAARYELNPTARNLVASQARGIQYIGKNYDVAITDQVAHILADTKHWVLERAQKALFNPTALPGTPEEAIAESMYDAFFSQADHYGAEYGAQTTAQMISRKIIEMRDNKRHDRSTQKNRIMYDARVLGTWIALVFLSFTHPVEENMIGVEALFGRTKEQDIAIGESVEPKMRLGQVPFGRQLSTNPFLLQFIRISLNSLYEKVVCELAEQLKEDETTTFDFDPVAYVDVLLKALEEENGNLLELQEKLAESDEETSAKLVTEYLEAPIRKDTALRVKGNATLATQRKYRTQAWAVVRRGLLEYKFDPEIVNMPATKMFVSRLFPIVF